MNKGFFNKGLSIVETVIALAILGIVGAAIIRIMLQVSTANNSSKLKNQAAIYAEEGLEQVRGNFLVPGNGYQWIYQLAPATGTICYANGLNMTPTNSTSCTPGTPLDGVFSRTIGLTRLAGTGVELKSIIYWSEKGVSKSTEAHTFFYEY